MRGVRRILPSVPLFPVLMAFIVGIVLSTYIPNFCWLWSVLLLVVAVGVCAMAKLWHAVLCICFVGVGMMSEGLSAARVPIDCGEQVYAGVVRKAEHTPYGQRFIADIFSEPNRGVSAMVSYPLGLPIVEVGDTAVFRGVLTEVDAGVSVPGEFSWKLYSLRHNLTAFCDVEDGELEVQCGAWSLSSAMDSWRVRFSDFVYYRSGLSPEAAVMLDAVLAGNADAISDSERATFAKAGVAHVLALSGTHVAVIAMLVSLLFFPLAVAGHRHWGVLCALVVLWLYVLFTGCSPSVVRAVTMASVVMVGALLRRSGSSLNSLCFAALVILLFEPRDLYAPGFQLSFAAVAGILMFALEMRVYQSHFPRGMHWLIGWVMVCVSAVVATAPIAAWHFHQMPVWFLLANLPVCVCLPWFMGGGILLLVLQAAGLPAHWLVVAVEWCYYVMSGVSTWVASLPMAAVERLYFPWWVMLPFYAALLSLWLWIKKQRGVYGCIGAILMLFSGGCYRLMHPNYPRVEAYGVHSDYAASLLLREGERVWVLTDASEKFHDSMRENMMWRMRDFLNQRGVDSLVVTNSVKDAEAFYADSVCWVVGDKAISVADAVIEIGKWNGLKVDYLLLSRRFKGSVGEFYRTFKPKNGVILSPAIFPTRREKIKHELDSLQIPYVEGLESVQWLVDD